MTPTDTAVKEFMRAVTTETILDELEEFVSPEPSPFQRLVKLGRMEIPRWRGQLNHHKGTITRLKRNAHIGTGPPNQGSKG